MRATALVILTAVVGAGLVLFCRQSCPPKRSLKDGSSISELLTPAPPEALRTQKRMHEKRELAKRIVVERIPLLVAAEMFREVNGEEGMRLLHLSLQGQSIREKLCRHVIGHVSTAEREMNGTGHVIPEPALSATMQAELDRRIAAGEFPRDPEPSE